MTDYYWIEMAEHCASRLRVLLEARVTPSGRVRFNYLLSREQKRALLDKREWGWHSRPAFLVNTTEGSLERSLVASGKDHLAPDGAAAAHGRGQFPYRFLGVPGGVSNPAPRQLF